MPEQIYLKGFCKVEGEETTFITHLMDNQIVCCTTCSFSRPRVKEDRVTKRDKKEDSNENKN